MARGRYIERSWAPDFDSSTKRGARARRYRAFVPEPVAQAEFEFSSASAALAERAGNAIRDLNETSGALVALDGLGRQLLRSEALASSQIEGLSVSHRKLAEASLSGHASHRAAEVLANTRAMQLAIEIGARSRGLRPKHLRDIHRALATTPPLDRHAGRFRKEQSWIGGVAPPDAEYVGPPPEEVERLIADLCEFCGRDDVSPVAQAAIAHAQFELIHPFADGNGRVGRCLIHVILRSRGAAPNYAPPVSLALGSDKDAYIAGITAFKDDRASVWIDHFARAVERSVAEAVRFSDAVTTLQQQWSGELADLRADAAARALIEHLPAHPYITVRVAQKLTGRSNPAAHNGLVELEARGILTRHPNRRKGDTWEAKQLFSLLARFEDRVKHPAESRR